MLNLNKILEPAKTIAIGGHVRPDGDCVWILYGNVSVYPK